MRFRALAAVCAAAGCLAAVPASALATGSTTTTPTTPSTTTTTTPTTPTPAPTVAPARATAKLYLHSLVRVGHTGDLTVPGRAVSVSAVVRPYVPGQRVLIQAFDGSRIFAQNLVVLAPDKRHVYGGFTVTLHAPVAGQVAVRLKHTASATLSAFGVETHYRVLSETLRLGATGTFVALLQSRLAALHLYIPQTGVFDNGTELALDAYHRLLGWGEGDVTVTPLTVTDLLDGVGAFHVRYPGQGYHAEGDLSDQVLAYINGDRVQYLLPISSGKPSTPTVLGNYQVYRKQPGYLPDGMFYSNFFIGGYAIHGYDPAPDYPASHGCMRIPIVDALFAYGLLTVGNWVDTYYT